MALEHRMETCCLRGLCAVERLSNKRRGTVVSKRCYVRVVALVAGLAFGVTGCTIDLASPEKEQAASTTVEKKPAPVVSVSDGASKVNPADPVVVKSLGEGLSDVTMTNENGKVVEGEMAADARSWRTAEPLGYSRSYTVVATDRNGEKTTTEFTTVVPDGQAFASLAPLDGATVGVAQVIALRFDYVVNDRKAVEDAVKITTEPAVEGAFFWISPYEVRWRPEHFWEPGTQVTVKADLYGKDLGNGIYGDNDNSATFAIGDRVEAVADDATKTMVIYKNGQQVNSMPVSMGANKWPTPNGIYTIGDKNPSLIMDSETYGLAHNDGGYRTEVKFATQMSYSGIYVHAAPWSVWAQGSSNTSHGCINVSTDNAAWFQNYVKRGDIVRVQNTIGGTLNGYDGLGDWNIDWATWKAGNANG